jgi:hypothetical protein
MWSVDSSHFPAVYSQVRLAPTGAVSCVQETFYSQRSHFISLKGKTDVAMLAILRVLDQHRSPSSGNASIASTINKSSFKIIYV